AAIVTLPECSASVSAVLPGRSSRLDNRNYSLMPHRIAITGASGYLGRHLTTGLLGRGHQVRALVRPGKAQRVAPGAESVELDPFDVNELAPALQGCNTVVHLIGTPHPNPSKAAEFLRVDLASARVCIAAAARCAPALPHFVYVSVAHPAPVMET